MLKVMNLSSFIKFNSVALANIYLVLLLGSVITLFNFLVDPHCQGFYHIGKHYSWRTNLRVIQHEARLLVPRDGKTYRKLDLRLCRLRFGVVLEFPSTKEKNGDFLLTYC